MAEQSHLSTYLTDAEKQLLLAVARNAIRDHLAGSRFVLPSVDDGALLEHRATFVTLRERATGELRGCRGESRPTRPLVQAVARTAVISATDDPRFPAVTADELDELQIEVSVLSPLVPITPDEVELGRHGLLLKRGWAVGLFLPQVPIEQQWSREEYLRWLCRKANLPDDALEAPDAELFAFETETWEEDPT